MADRSCNFDCYDLVNTACAASKLPAAIAYSRSRSAFSLACAALHAHAHVRLVDQNLAVLKFIEIVVAALNGQLSAE